MNKLFLFGLSLLCLALIPSVSATLSDNLSSSYSSITLLTPNSNVTTIETILPTISWQTCGASFYVVELSDTNDFSNLIETVQTITTSADLTTTLSIQEYFMRVYGLETNVTCASEIYSYQIIDEPDFEIIYSGDAYASTNIVNFNISAPESATVTVNISDVNSAFFLPVTLSDLSQPSFSTVLIPGAYVISAAMNYAGTLINFDDILIVPFPGTNGGSSSSNTPTTNLQEENSQSESIGIFNLKIDVTNFDDEPLKDAQVYVKFDNETISYDLNKSGEVNISLDEGEYEIRVVDDKHIGQRKKVDLDENKSISFILVSKEDKDVEAVTLSDPSFSITINAPSNDKKYPDYAIPLKFSITDSSSVERCQILSKQKGSSGYTIKETIVSPKETNEKNIALIDGEHTLQIRCLDSKGEEFALSNTINVISVSLGNIEQETSTYTKNIVSSLESIENLPEEVKKSSFIIDEKTNLENAKSYISSTLDTLYNLPEDIDVDQVKNELNTKLKNYDSSLLKSAELTSSSSIVPFVDLEKINGFSVFFPDQELSYLDSIQDSFIIKLTVEEFELNYLSAESKTLTSFSQSISATDTLVQQNPSILEDSSFHYLVPNDLVPYILSQKIDLIEGTEYSLITMSSSLPLLFSKSLSFQQKELITPIIEPEEQVDISSNQLTGNTILGGPTWKVPLISFLVLIILAGLFLNPYMSFFDLQTKKKVKSFTSILSACLDATEKKEYFYAMELFPKVIKQYDRLPSKNKQDVHELMLKAKYLFYESHFNLLARRIANAQSHQHIHHTLAEIHNAFSHLTEYQKQIHLPKLKESIARVEALISADQQKVFKNEGVTKR